MNLSIRLKITSLLLLLYTVLFGISVMFVYERFSTGIQEYLDTQNVWLQTYAQTFIDDLKIGRTASINRKLNYLVRQKMVDEISINFPGNSMHASRGEADPDQSSWLWKKLFGHRFNPVKLPLIDNHNTTWGNLETTPSKEFSRKSFEKDFNLYVLISLGLLLIYLSLTLSVVSSIVEPIRKLTNRVRAKSTKRNISVRGDELTTLSSAFDAYEDEIGLANSKLKEQAKQQAFAQLAKQVAHDIRSPLTSLEMVSSSFIGLAEEKRTILRNSINRIRDIANSLLAKKSEDNLFSQQNLDSFENNWSTELLTPLIEAIITEKRIQFRDSLNAQIEFIPSKDSYGAFALIQVNEFSRALSNLIDNSFEALPDAEGKISIELSSSLTTVEIIITDTGIGIPSEKLSLLGKKGVTFGKTDGSGLGLHHAIQTIRSSRGDLYINSETSKKSRGTSIRISLPVAEPPNWFVPKLTVTNKSKIVVFDDDLSIHNVWKTRFSESNNSKNEISLTHISNPSRLRKFFGENFETTHSTLFLMDYEIINHPETGLELINELGIQDNAILVTGRYDDLNIRSNCDRLGVKLIPKSMSRWVPIEIVAV